MNRFPFLSSLLLGLALSGPSLAKATTVVDPNIPRELPTTHAVSIDWTDPAQFTDLRYSGNRWEAERGNWVVDLASYLQRQAGKRLDSGQQMHITITDIRRAGQYEPYHGFNTAHIRIIKDIYPPRVTLNFELKDANGQILAQGERKLVDNGFMMGSGSPLNTDPLRYEKRMLDDWLYREFKRNDA